jgi:hypothetical protein
LNKTSNSPVVHIKNSHKRLSYPITSRFPINHRSTATSLFGEAKYFKNIIKDAERIFKLTPARIVESESDLNALNEKSIIKTAKRAPARDAIPEGINPFKIIIEKDKKSELIPEIPRT